MKHKNTNLPPLVAEDKSLINPSDNETRFFADILSLLQTARGNAYRTVNTVMVETYWKIGERIVQQEQNGKGRANYGDYLIVNLSRYLGDTFGRGFSEANLQKFPTQRVRNLTWTNIRQIIRIDDKEERDYYFRESAAQNWSSRTLERNIKTGYYRRLLSTQKPMLPVTDKVDKHNLADFIKDPYILEFLGVPEDLIRMETQLETALINNLQKFLLEMGKGFSFVARQMRVSTETEHFYVDLVFCNYLLKCFVIIDLKTTKLTHQDIGQMDMYVRMFDALKRSEDDNPTIGIIFCTDKSETMVKYSVLKESKQIFASKYMTILPTEAELAAEIERNANMLRGGEEYE